MTTLNDIAADESRGDLAAHPGRKMTEEEFVEWFPDKGRAEWVDGEVIMMATASREHDDLVGWLVAVLRMFARRKDAGTIHGPEFMVRLGKQRRRRLPDVLFVAKDRASILRKNHVEGAPDLVVEIVSQDSGSRDWREKYLDYEAAGVREYWVIDPGSQIVEVYALGSDSKYAKLAPSDGKIASTVLAGLYVRPDWLWQQPLPDELDVAKEFGLIP